MRLLARWGLLGFAAALLAGGLAAGCGQGSGSDDGQKDLTFETLPGGIDTSGLTNGKPLVASFDLIRMNTGALRVTGKTRLPEGTRIQVSVHDMKSNAMVASTQVTVDHGTFGSPPFMGDMGPLPVARYRVEILSHFTSEWQPANVLSETGGGKRLRGPGITRSKVDGAALYLVEEMKR